MVSLSDSSSYLAEKLEENEAKARELTRTWIDKWQEAQEIMKVNLTKSNTVFPLSVAQDA